MIKLFNALSALRIDWIAIYIYILCLLVSWDELLVYFLNFSATCGLHLRPAAIVCGEEKPGGNYTLR